MHNMLSAMYASQVSGPLCINLTIRVMHSTAKVDMAPTIGMHVAGAGAVQP